jgi:hypothetical protein
MKRRNKNMYVISQKGTVTINAKSTIGFKINQEFMGEVFEISAISTDCAYIIGRYKTEERAKEVLQQLMDYYSEAEKRMVYAMGDGNYTFENPYYFKMPEE